MKQQQSEALPGPPARLKAYDLPHSLLRVSCRPTIYNHELQLTAAVQLTPKRDLANTPLEIELRGYSHIQAFNHPGAKPSEKSLQVTEDFLNESDQKLEINVLMGESKKFEEVESEVTGSREGVEEMNEDGRKEGEYFLEGCNVLYQIDEATGERLQTLAKGQKYRYPINFSLPSRLPSSVDHIILKTVHIIIKYSLELKLILVGKQQGKKQCQTIIIPFEIQESEKQYPYEELVVRELIRFYHSEGKREDEVMSRPFAKFVDCLCPRFVYDKYLTHHNHFKSTFKTYDLYHVELVAIVNKGSHIFLLVRAYQEPEADSLTLNREKKNEKRSAIKQVNSLGEVPNDISLVSMKPTARKQVGLGVHRVEVEMVGELVGIAKHPIFKKVVSLSQSTYDMLEGEIMINLAEYMSFTRSCNNQLFALRYYFNIKAIFEEEEGDAPRTAQFEDFVVESNKKDLCL